MILHFNDFFSKQICNKFLKHSSKQTILYLYKFHVLKVLNDFKHAWELELKNTFIDSSGSKNLTQFTHLRKAA